MSALASILGDWHYTGVAFQTDGTHLYTFTARATVEEVEDGGGVRVIIQTNEKESRSVSEAAIPRLLPDGSTRIFYDYAADPGHFATAGHDFFGMVRVTFAADGQSAAGNYMNFNGRYTCGECHWARV
ncbi:MAG TPA: hypothetical protein VF475_14760 [Sphingobium sp.]